MFPVTNQGGRSRVNWVSDSKKTRKTHVQHKKKTETGKDKLFQLQTQFLKDGMNFLEYEKYIQGKINKDMFYYKNLSQKDVEDLHNRYKSLLQKGTNKYNEIGVQKEMNRRQRKLFREKKKKIIDKQLDGMISKFLNIASNSTALGISKKCNSLPSDPEKWVETKKRIFFGGRYIEKQDRESWVETYRKIVSPVKAHLFDLHSHDALNKFVFDY